MVRSILRSVVLVGLCGSTPAWAWDVLYQQTYDGPGLPADWVFDTDGDWSIVGGTLDQSLATPMPGHADAWAGDLAWTDYSVEMTFTFLEFGSYSMEAGLGLRHDQLALTGNFFVTRVAWRGGAEGWNLEVVRTNASEIHIPLGQNLITNTPYTMRSEIIGDHLRVWVNNILYDVGSINADGFIAPTSGCVGVWSNMAHTQFDNVIVRGEGVDPEPTLPLGPTTLVLVGTGLAGIGFVGLRRRHP